LPLLAAAALPPRRHSDRAAVEHAASLPASLLLLPP
jgi:hypothetical protein